MKTPGYAFAAFLGLSFAAYAQAPKVNYTDHILPVFRNACTNCHNPDKKKAGLDLTTYQGTIAGGESGASVKPGNPDGSLLYKLSAHLDEPKMPPKGDKLNDAELKLIKDWITAFALETANSKPVVAQANKVDSAVVSLTRPEGPAPMPGDLPLEPFFKARALGAATTLAASPWAPLVAVGGQKQVLLYNVETLDRLGILSFPEGFPNVLRFSKNAKLLLAGGGVGGKSGKVVLWDVTTGERVGSVGNESDAVLAADLSADHQFVALGGAEKRVKIYQTKDGKQTGLIKKHTDWVTAIAYSPDGKYLGTGDRNGGIEIWESAPDPKPFNTLAGHKSAVTALAFMPGVLASGSEDGKITLWNVKEGNETKSWTAHAGGVLWVDFTPDGRLVSSGRDKLAKVWDATGKAIATTEAFGDLAIRAAMNGQRVIASDWTGDIRVFALADGKANRIGELSANPPGIGEQLAAAEKTLAEAGAALPALQKAVADAEAKAKAETEAAEAKRKADIAAAEARKAAAQKQLDDAKAAPANAEKAVNDLNSRLAAAKQAIEKARQNLDAKKKAMASQDRAKAEAEVASAQKRVDALTADLAKRREARSKAAQGSPDYVKADAAVQAAKPDLAKAEQALESAKAKLNGAPAAGSAAEIDAANLALAEATKMGEALKAQLQQAQQAYAKAKSDAPKAAAEAEKAIAAASAEISKLSNPAAPAPVVKAGAAGQSNGARIAELQKKYEALSAPLAALRAERAKFEKGTPAYEKADAAVQAKKKEIKYDEELANKLATEISALQESGGKPEAPAPAAPAQSEAMQALSKAKTDLDATNARIAAAKASLERWKRAQLYQNVFNARQTVTARQAKYDDLVATAKDAFRPVELTKQAIIAAEKTIADGPKTIAEKEAALAAAKKTVSDIKSSLDAAEKALEARRSEMPDPKKIEAEIAGYTQKLDAITAAIAPLRAERAKQKEGSPEYAKADAAVQARKKELNSEAETAKLTAAIEAAKARLTAKPGSVPPPKEMVEAVKKTQLDLKLATDKLVPAEKAVADAKAAIADATKQIPELKARIPQLEAEGRKTKLQAEQAAAVTAKELQAAKVEFEKLRATYEAAKGAPAQGASTASVAPLQR